MPASLCRIAQNVLHSHTTLCRQVGLWHQQGRDLTAGLTGPKIHAMSTSHTTLRKNSTVQNFLNTSILENIYVTQSRQSLFEKQVSFCHEWVGIMKISAQVRQMFVLSPLGTGKLQEIFRAVELRWKSCWRLPALPPLASEGALKHALLYPCWPR